MNTLSQWLNAINDYLKDDLLGLTLQQYEER